MKPFLVDVNLLVALAWPEHEFHLKAQRWFARNAKGGWATCPMVEAGFVRLLSNPAFSEWAVSPNEAVLALAESTQLPGHQFWPDGISVTDALAPFQDSFSGHQQTTDLYLLSLAIHHGGKFATLDRKISRILAEHHSSLQNLEII